MIDTDFNNGSPATYAGAGENMDFYSCDIYITNDAIYDLLIIAQTIQEKIRTNNRNISFSVTVRAGIVFKVSGYLYADKKYGLFLIYDYMSGLREKISLREGKFNRIS